MNRFLFLVFLSLSVTINVFSQKLTQSIRGKVVDNDVKIPLQGVNILIESDGERYGGITDENGYFAVDNVLIGRVDISFSYLGYKSYVLNNLYLYSAKELVLDVEMKEDLTILDEIVLETKRGEEMEVDKLKAVNPKEISYKKSNLFAGSVGDPARMVSNYAGVNQSSDERNDIIVRGNSPLGIAWRVEDIEIHSPNHFSSMGTTGGAVPMLNNNMLDKSNFYSSAFPSNYGNAFAGLFDIQLRHGNNTKREWTGQISMSGLELGAEGPYHEDYNGSYIASARYADFSGIEYIVDFGYSGTPRYTDAMFKTDLPIGENSKIETWGLYGYSKMKTKGDPNNREISKKYDIDFNSELGVGAITYKYFFNDAIRHKLSYALSYKKVGENKEKQKVKIKTSNSKEYLNIINYQLIYKYSKWHLLKLGSGVNFINVNYHSKSLEEAIGKKHLKNDELHIKKIDDFRKISSYVEYKNRSIPNTVVNSGIHFQYFELNDSYSLEPRVNVVFEIVNDQTLNIGYGKHSQLVALNFLYETNNEENKSLDLVKANHFIVGYSNKFYENWIFSSEIYFQDLYNIPVTKFPSSYSYLNSGSDFSSFVPSEKLKNLGTGTNYGLEVTIEKTLTGEALDYYMLFTGSLYDSKYAGSDKVYRRTKWAGVFMLNTISGIEWTFGDNNQHVLGFNMKVKYAGGNRHNVLEKRDKEVILHPLFDKNPDYKRLDLKFLYKLNTQNTSHELGIDIQNVFNIRNVREVHYYIDELNNINKTNFLQLGLIPILSYKIYF
ncbi:TonB-dependent receptor [Ichthyobacterium seriolicida]|uniref:TonB-dependent receptor n=1 Tax=Ichthyobacterium seriolicida TaxID=242600 RepID=A0A1J1E479_9FLAO|nr:carboxypeptidase-like regulatory domain-containing protein [Ichthyobacterium seriolicida]BAV94852.1 TonB-dependent receptor [Ichthyobacterium seriolicida]